MGSRGIRPMSSHEEFLELCASATAGELSADEQKRLEAHLTECADCRRAMSEYEAAARTATSALAQEFATKDEAVDGPWSPENAEKTLFERLDKEQADQESEHIGYGQPD